MVSEALLRDVSTGQLSHARSLAHRATQHLTQAARANLEARSDDSHSNLGWDAAQGAFLTQSIDGRFVGLSLAPLQIFVIDEKQMREDIYLNGISTKEVDKWLDTRLTALGLNAASTVDLPYELPADVAAVEIYSESDHALALQALAAWYEQASHNLEKLVADTSDFSPGPSPVRCWPHHFDIATYVSLEHGDPETARGIGVGMSPGDEGYVEPYFYINPWPHLDKNNLPAPIEPGHWHIEGYVGLVATATQLRSAGTIAETIAGFVPQAFKTAKSAQGA